MEEKKPDLPIEVKARRSYFKEWRKKNPDKVKKHNQTFWNKQVNKLEKKK